MRNESGAPNDKTHPNDRLNASSEETRALTLELRRTLEGRCDVLLRSAPVGVVDVPVVLGRLRAFDDAVIRQPPVAAQRALSVVRNSMSSSAQLAAVFEGDPALAEALLRAANSSHYHRGTEPCLSIPDAIGLVGWNGIEMIVTTKIVEGLLSRPGGAYVTLAADLWQHMLRTAPLAHRLAPAFGVVPEMAFTTGLLHDAGKLIVFDLLSQLRGERRREIIIPERFFLDVLGRLHEPLGALATLKWNLGASTAVAIACHHFEPPPADPNPLGELLCIAERTDHAVRTGKPLDLDHVWTDAQLTTEPGPVRDVLIGVQGLVLVPPRHRRVA